MGIVKERMDQNKPLLGCLNKVYQKLKTICQGLKVALKNGKICLKQAKWIGLDEYIIFYYIFNCFNA